MKPKFPSYRHLTVYNTSTKNSQYLNFLNSVSTAEHASSSTLHNINHLLKAAPESPHSSKGLLNTNVNFLRKERLYTKLKYSRSPAYDIVSGGAAAILAGFVGFLISEKFGFELVDSGDFYYLFMYAVFATFFMRPLLTTMNFNNKISSIFSLKPILRFYVLIISFTFQKLK